MNKSGDNSVGAPASEMEALARECGVPFLSDIPESIFDSALLARVPVEWARERAALPARSADGHDALLIVSGPDDLPLVERVSLACGEALRPAFAPRAVIMRAIDAAYFSASAAAQATSAAPAEMAASARDNETTAPTAGGGAESGAGSSSAAEDLLVARGEPAARLLNAMLLSAVRQNASDVHLEPDGANGARVRFRLAGRLYEQAEFAVAPPLGPQVVSRLKVLSGMDIAEHRLPQDGMTQVRAGARVLDIRVSTIPAAGGERAVMRILDREDSLMPLPDLGMDGPVLDGFSSLLSRPNGIVAVCGPTGSGKTTTLYAALRSLDVRRRNVMTIEDPVEYRIDGISQMQVRPRIGLTFASGLRSVLRQDPDVVLVGETRDPETAEIAVRASLTGHLVLTTLHTNDAPSAVMRLVDMGVEPYLLASCLRGVLAQRLVRKCCPQCATLFEFGAPGVSAAEEALARAAGCDGVLRANAAGCGRCLEGYSGRTGLFELLPCSEEVSVAIHDGRLSAADLRAAACRPGADDGGGGGKARFRPMSEDASEKLRTRITTPAEVLAALGTF